MCISSQKPDVQPQEVKSGVLVDRAIAAAQAALEVVDGKATPEEVREFKDFLYACGSAVANAAGSGLFGSGNPKVSQEEATTLTKLQTALG